jgi:hypothetical protein
MNDQWKFGRHFLGWNFWLSWLGIFCLLLAQFFGKSDSTSASMFGALALNLTGTIGFIVGGKATEHLVNTRWGGDGCQDTMAQSSSVQGPQS